MTLTCYKVSFQNRSAAKVGATAKAGCRERTERARNIMPRTNRGARKAARVRS